MREKNDAVEGRVRGQEKSQTQENQGIKELISCVFKVTASQDIGCQDLQIAPMGCYRLLAVSIQLIPVTEDTAKGIQLIETYASREMV